MAKVNSYLPFVKEQQTLHEKLARRYDEQPWRRDMHIGTANRFATLAEDMAAWQAFLNDADRERAAKQGGGSLARLPLTPEDLAGLPDDLIKELSISDADKLEFQIISLIDQAGGALSLDRILIGVYKTTGDIYKRNVMNAKLYRMGQKNLLFPVPGKKGVYSTEEIAGKPDAELPGLRTAEEIIAANIRPTSG